MQIKAVIGKLAIRRFCNTKTDESISKGVRELHKLTGNAGVWVKNKINPVALEPISKIATIARTEFYRRTLYWELASRLVPLDNREALEAKIAELREEFQKEVKAFVKQWPTYVAEAKEMHNGTFNEDDYPDKDSIAGEFEMRIELAPFPQASHFDSGLRKLYGDMLEESNKMKIENAVRDQWDRVLVPLRNMATKLSTKDAIFRDSLVENVREALGLIPVLNVTGDAKLKQAADQIRAMIAGISADTLRENVTTRGRVGKAAGALVAQFGKFGGRKITED